MSAVTEEAWVEIEGREPSRLLALSDGLFATVLTILVLDLKLPDLAQAVSAGNLRTALMDFWPHMFAYVLTFLVGGLYWLAHHRAYDHIVRTNQSLLWHNLMFLLFVGLLPLSTANLANRFSPISWAIYSLDMGGVGAMMVVIWAYASSHGLINPRMPRRFRRYLTLRYLNTPVLFLISAVVQFAIPQVGLGPWLMPLIPVMQLLLDRLFFGRGTQSIPWRSRAQDWAWRLVGLLPLIGLIAFTIWLFA